MGLLVSSFLLHFFLIKFFFNRYYLVVYNRNLSRLRGKPDNAVI